MIGAEAPPQSRGARRRRRTNRRNGATMTDSKQNDFAWKATSALTLLASGIVAEKVVAAGWKAVTGRPAPKKDQLLTYRLGDVVAFAVVSGAVLSLTSQLTLRRAAKWYRDRGLAPFTDGAPAIGALEA